LFSRSFALNTTISTHKERHQNHKKVALINISAFFPFPKTPDFEEIGLDQVVQGSVAKFELSLCCFKAKVLFATFLFSFNCLFDTRGLVDADNGVLEDLAVGQAVGVVEVLGAVIK
jgi:hypothetical protein